MYFRPVLIERWVAYITVVFGVMTAVAWNAAIVEAFITPDGKSVAPLFIFAIVVTIIGVLSIYAAGKLTHVE